MERSLTTMFKQMSRFSRGEGLILRPYQTRIVKTIRHENAIVLLPTGSGKTAIAADAIAQFLNEDPTKRQ